MRFLCFAGSLAQHNRICKHGRSEPKDSVKLLLQLRKPRVAATVKKQNRAAHEGLPGLLLSCIINLHETDIKRAARAGLFDVLKNHAFCMSPLRLNREKQCYAFPGGPSTEGMTDYQFKTVIRMVMTIIKDSESKEEILKKPEALLDKVSKATSCHTNGAELAAALSCLHCIMSCPVNQERT